MEKVKVSTGAGISKQLSPTFMNDFEGFKTLMEEGTADVVEQIKWFLETKYTLGEDAVMTAEMTTEDS